MKLFAVIHSLGCIDFSSPSIPNIAGIYTNESIANVISKAVGSNAKVVPVTIDEVEASYISFAKDILNVDIVTIMREEEFGLKKLSKFERECMMTAEEFIEDSDSGCLTSTDGSGCWATETQISGLSCWYEQPEWATHVCWFNK